MLKILLTGNVGKEPEIKTSQDGTQYAHFSMGVNIGKGKTSWVDISCKGKLVEVVTSYIHKGSKLLVEGFPSVNAYVNRDNKPVGQLKVFASNIEMLSKKDGEQEQASNNSQVLDTDDLNAIPF